jgi:hypothetical protein
MSPRRSALTTQAKVQTPLCCDFDLQDRTPVMSFTRLRIPPLFLLPLCLKKHKARELSEIRKGGILWLLGLGLSDRKLALFFCCSDWRQPGRIPGGRH